MSVSLHKYTATQLETSHPGDTTKVAECEANYRVTEESAITLIISVKVCDCMHS